MPTRIDVNITGSRAANARLLPIRDRVDNVSTRLLHMLSEIDLRILDQANLKARLTTTHRNIVLIEADIQNLYTSINGMLNGYEEADNRGHIKNLDI